jgi:hypothetical protein
VVASADSDACAHGSCRHPRSARNQTLAHRAALSIQPQKRDSSKINLLEIPRRPRLRSWPCTLDSFLERRPESVKAAIATPVLEWHDPALSWHRVHLNAAGVETMRGDVDLQTPSNGDSDSGGSKGRVRWDNTRTCGQLGLPDVTGKCAGFHSAFFGPMPFAIAAPEPAPCTLFVATAPGTQWPKGEQEVESAR